MDLRIISLNETYYKDALEIALEAKIGVEEEILDSMNDFDKFYVAILDNQVVGEIGWYKDDGSFAGEALGDKFPLGSDVYWLDYFAIKPEYRNQGLGTKMLKFIEKVLQDKGAKEIWVYTSRARKFYEKNGYTYVCTVFIENLNQEVLRKKVERQPLDPETSSG